MMLAMLVLGCPKIWEIDPTPSRDWGAPASPERSTAPAPAPVETVVRCGWVTIEYRAADPWADPARDPPSGRVQFMVEEPGSIPAEGITVVFNGTDVRPGRASGTFVEDISSLPTMVGALDSLGRTCYAEISAAGSVTQPEYVPFDLRGPVIVVKDWSPPPPPPPPRPPPPPPPTDRLTCALDGVRWAIIKFTSGMQLWEQEVADAAAELRPTGSTPRHGTVDVVVEDSSLEGTAGGLYVIAFGPTGDIRRTQDGIGFWLDDRWANLFTENLPSEPPIVVHVIRTVSPSIRCSVRISAEGVVTPIAPASP